MNIVVVVWQLHYVGCIFRMHACVCVQILLNLIFSGNIIKNENTEKGVKMVMSRMWMTKDVINRRIIFQ